MQAYDPNYKSWTRPQLKKRIAELEAELKTTKARLAVELTNKANENSAKVPRGEQCSR